MSDPKVSAALKPSHPPTYPNEVWFDMDTMLSAAQPTSIALIGEFETNFVQNYIQQTEILGRSCELVRLNPEQLFEQIEVIDLVIVANSLEHLAKPTATQLLSRLRDLLSKQFMLCLPLETNLGINNSSRTGWIVSELFALGLKRNASYHSHGREYGLFSYRIENYKKTPDWLNSDNWANPEMWGKYWW